MTPIFPETGPIDPKPYRLGNGMPVLKVRYMPGRYRVYYGDDQFTDVDAFGRQLTLGERSGDLDVVLVQPEPNHLKTLLDAALALKKRPDGIEFSLELAGGDALALQLGLTKSELWRIRHGETTEKPYTIEPRWYFVLQTDNILWVEHERAKNGGRFGLAVARKSTITQATGVRDEVAADAAPPVASTGARKDDSGKLQSPSSTPQPPQHDGEDHQNRQG